MKKFILIITTTLLFLTGCNSASGGSSNSNFNVTSITPANNSDISATQSFVANFSNNVNPSTANNVTLKTSGGVNVPLDCGVNGATAIKCTPTTQLSFGTGYTLSFGSGIQNPAGNSLTPASYDYTTNSNPSITTITPNNNSTIGISDINFVATFDTAMNTATFTNTNITLNDTTASTTVPMTCGAQSESIASCTPNNNLTPYHNYTLTYTNLVMSKTGIPINQVNFNYTNGTPTSYNLSQKINASGRTVIIQNSSYLFVPNGSGNIIVYNYINGDYVSVYNGAGPTTLGSNGISNNISASYNNIAYLLDSSNGSIWSYSKGQFLNITGNLSGWAYSIAISGSNIIASTQTGIYYSTGGNSWNSITPENYNFIGTLATDNNGNIYYASMGSTSTPTSVNIISYENNVWNNVATYNSENYSYLADSIQNFAVENGIIYLELGIPLTSYKTQLMMKYVNNSWQQLSALSGFSAINGVYVGMDYLYVNNGTVYYYASGAGLSSLNSGSSQWNTLNTQYNGIISNFGMDSLYNIYYSNGYLGTPQ